MLSEESFEEDDKEIAQHDFRDVLKTHIEPQQKMKPQFLSALSDQRVKQYSTVTMQCTVQANPEPEIQWTVNKKPIKVSVRIRMSVGPSDELRCMKNAICFELVANFITIL